MVLPIRPINHADIQEWSCLRTALWPQTPDRHMAEIRAFFAGTSVDVVQVFVLEQSGNELAGFIELNIRNFAEGTSMPRVPYVEAWYVDPEYRGKGYGKNLIQHAEQWALDQGYTELGSDAELHNPDGIAAHNAVGFKEIERIVCFLKPLN